MRASGSMGGLKRKVDGLGLEVLRGLGFVNGLARLDTVQDITMQKSNEQIHKQQRV